MLTLNSEQLSQQEMEPEEWPAAGETAAAAGGGPAGPASHQQQEQEQEQQEQEQQEQEEQEHEAAAPEIPQTRLVQQYLDECEEQGAPPLASIARHRAAADPPGQAAALS
jgi:TATA-binding protein-associated factor Taf7